MDMSTATGGEIPEGPQEVQDEEDAAPREPHSLNILDVIKTSQNQNGLRHSDFQRYRQYCGRRLRRMRVGVKFTHGKGKEYKKRELDARTAKDVRHLMLLLVNAERAWSFAMHLKQESASGADASARYRVHSMRRLRKASTWATQLREICAATADAKTQLEADAYAAWMRGNVALESEQWSAAKEAFAATTSAYAKLNAMEFNDLYDLRIQEIEPSIRYCDYNIQRFGGGGGGDSAAKAAADTKALLELKAAQTNALLQSKLDSALKETRKAKVSESATSSGVRWRGADVPLDNAQVSAKVLEAKEHEMALTQGGGDDDEERKEEVYSALLTCMDEALQAVRTDQSREKAGGASPALESCAQYLEFHKLRHTVARHSLLVAAREAALQVADGAVAAGAARDAKAPGPKELASLYHQMSQYVGAMLAVPGAAEDPDSDAALLAAQQLHYQAARCFFSARTFMEMKQLWAHAHVLFERAATVCHEAINAYGNVGKKDGVDIADAVSALDRIATTSLGNMATVRAKGFFDANREELSLASDLADLTLSTKDIVSKGHVVELMDRLGKLVPDNARLGDPAVSRLTSLPPMFQVREMRAAHARVH